jgi:hypothetical protein
MLAFPTPDALAQSFVKSYYMTAIYDLSNLFKYYAGDAAVGRGGRISRDPISIKSTRLLSLNNPPDSSVTIVNFTAVRLGDQVQIDVTGFAIQPNGRHGFTQTFVLREVNGRLWIALDVFSLFDDAFYEQAAPDDFFTLNDSRPPEPPRQPKHAAQPSPPKREAPPADEKPRAQPKAPPADADEEPRAQPKAQPPRSERGKRRGKQDRRKGRDKFEWRSPDD